MVMLYHLVCVAKYRKVILTKPVDKTLREICLEIAKRYEIHFLEIGTDDDHVHFLIQSVPMMLPQKIAQIIKSITAKKVFQQVPEVKKELWGGEFWTDGYYISTVSGRGDKSVIEKYIQNQGRANDLKQLQLFEL